jgi:ectoine hydroxylase-related dioxygenase (phytanoyl-CoA dioxygenase family)
MSTEEAAHYRLACERLQAQLGGRPRTVEVRQMHLHFVWAYRLAAHERVLDAVEDLLGPDLLITATELFAKPARDGVMAIAWHRDGTYMGLDPEQSVTAWIALTRSGRENGCLRAVRDPDRKSAGRHANGRRMAVADVPSGDAVDVELEAGEMSLHDVHVLHGSGTNHSDQQRVGFAVRITTPQTRPALDHPPAILARGEDRFGHFQLLDPPRSDADPNALAQMQSSARRHLEATLENLRQVSC